MDIFLITAVTGDLYFEKAVNGFLSDLFAKWKVWEFLFLFTKVAWNVMPVSIVNI